MLFKLFITSFGYKQAIKHTLKHCGLDRAVTEIITPKAIGLPEGVALSDKNKLIQYGLDRYNLRNGMLVDHWKAHVDAAIAAGHWGYFVHQGYTVNDITRIFRMVKNHNVEALFLSTDITHKHFEVKAQDTTDFKEPYIKMQSQTNYL